MLLLDEPLAALDRKLREETRFELKELQTRLQTTFVIVTHDQDEAMTVADRIAVMNRGQLAQVGAPVEVYERPNSRWVAGFVGDVNLIEGHVIGGLSVLRHGGSAKDCACACAHAPVAPGPVAVALRPEKIRIGHAVPAGRRRKRRRRDRHRHRLSRHGLASTRCGSTSGLVLKAAVMNEQRECRAHDPCERSRLAVVDARRRRAADGLTCKDAQQRHWLMRVAILAPYAWLLAFFLLPFLIVLKISFSQTAIAQPPYVPVLDLSAGWEGLKEFLRRAVARQLRERCSPTRSTPGPI